MLTELGKFLRKLRIDHGEILKNMADKLNVTASFLSAVENGKKRMPAAWNSLICSIYSLDDKQTEDFTKAVADSESSMEINFSKATKNQKKLAVSFARKFSDFDERQIQKFIELMREADRNK